MGQQETLPAKATHYLIWGDDPLDFPVPVQTTRDPDEPFSHVIVQSEENISQLYRALVSRRALLTPILNFSGTTLPRVA